MKFIKISPIRRYRIFRNFTWNATLPELGRYNVLYGWNGSGKTTLSSIFESIERNAALGSGECECSFEGGSIHGSEFASDKVRPSVKVFNRSYVDSTVFRSGSPGVPPIYYVAEGGADKQLRVEEIAVKLRGADGKGGLDAEFTTANNAVSRAGKDFDSFTTEQATVIREELRSAGNNSYNNYDKRGFQACADRLLQEGDAVIQSALLDEKTLKEQRQKKNATLLDRVELGDLPVIDVSALSALTGQVIAKTVVSTTIDALAKDPGAEQWVRSGLPLHGIQAGHTHAANCLFCEQGLTPDRVAQLEAHFNDSYQNFIFELNSVKGRVDAAASKLANPELPRTNEIAEHLREAYVAARENLETVYADQRAHLNWLQDGVSDKAKAPFQVLDLASYLKEKDRGMENPGPYISELNRLIDEHNQGILTFEQSVSSARTAIENGLVAKVLNDYKAKKEAPGNLQGAADKLSESRRALSEEAANLEREIRQHSVPAEELNAELRSYLGRDELKFSVQGAGYTIDRGGVRATDLSEGEKTAIAFLYFLKSLKGTNFDLANGVVVIDDPVSSLDANSLFCSFAYLSKRTIDAGQLIILTHNFLFLKQVKNWFEYLPRGQVRHYMVESYMEPEGRTAQIKEMDKMLRDHQSEYHYLFHRVMQGSLMPRGQALESYYGHPNMARRLLEVFLGFRFPGKPGFHKRIEALKADPVVIARIRRFVHTYSHEEGDGEDMDATMLAEAPSILASILEAIKLEDPGHYAEMDALVVAAEAANPA